MKRAKFYLIVFTSILTTILFNCKDGDDDPNNNNQVNECQSCSIECPDLCVKGFQSNLMITVDNTNRYYDVFLPSSHTTSSSNHPVIIDLHGALSTKEDQRLFSNFEGIAEANDVIVVWPQALNITTCLNSGNRWNANVTNQPDDVSFIDNLIDQIIIDYKVDLNRIYVSGLSNGGYLAYNLACALSNKIAAIASVAGTMNEDLMNNYCSPSRAVPIIQVHGTADQIISYTGFNSCEGHQASVEELVSFWGAKANCSSSYTIDILEDVDTTDNSSVKIHSYEDCTTGAIFKLVIIEGGGHIWPGSETFRDYYADYAHLLFPMNFDIDASEMIWEFFSDYSL